MEHWNRKVAASRGKNWKSSILSGRLDASRNPTSIRLARIKKALSQTEVADSLGLTYATYGAIESGRRKVKLERAKRIAELLGMSLKNSFAGAGNDKYLARKDSA